MSKPQKIFQFQSGYKVNINSAYPHPYAPKYLPFAVNFMPDICNVIILSENTNLLNLRRDTKCINNIKLTTYYKYYYE